MDDSAGALGDTAVLGGASAGVEDDPVEAVFDVGLYLLSSLSLFSFHHTSACCS